MGKVKNWLFYIVILSVIIALFIFGNKWTFMLAGIIIGAIIMFAVGYAIDKKNNG